METHTRIYCEKLTITILRRLEEGDGERMPRTKKGKNRGGTPLARSAVGRGSYRFGGYKIMWVS
jgi:hypothetical protein